MAQIIGSGPMAPIPCFQDPVTPSQNHKAQRLVTGIANGVWCSPGALVGAFEDNIIKNRDQNSNLSWGLV